MIDVAASRGHGAAREDAGGVNGADEVREGSGWIVAGRRQRPSDAEHRAVLVVHDHASPRGAAGAVACRVLGDASRDGAGQGVAFEGCRILAQAEPGAQGHRQGHVEAAASTSSGRAAVGAARGARGPGVAAVPCRDFVTVGGVAAFPLRARGRRAVSAMAQAVEELVGADLAASARVASRLRRSRCCVQVVHDALNCLHLALGDESRRALLVGLRPDVALAAGPIRAILQCVRVDGGECVVDGLPQGRQRHTGDGG